MSLHQEREIYVRELEQTNAALVAALQSMLNIFDREGSAPRVLASGEACLSIGAKTCDEAREALKGAA